MRMIAHLACWSLLSFVAPSSVRAQTAIIAVMTPDSIVIGADSKATTPDLSETVNQCKIENANGVLWARARYATDSGHGFSADAIARDTMTKSRTVKERVALFEQTVIPHLVEIMEERKRTARQWFDSQAEGKTVLEIVFATFEAQKPHLYFRYFKAYSIDGQRVRIEPKRHDCPGNCRTDTTIIEMGHHETVDKLKDNPQTWSAGVDEGVRTLIQSEIDACPRSVGPPITIVKLDVHGLAWISRGMCATDSQSNTAGPTSPNLTSICNEAP
jgi:hypothetical protein